LAKLDEGGAEFFQRHPNSFDELQMWQGLGGISTETLTPTVPDISQTDPVHEIAKAVIEQHGDDLTGPSEISKQPKGVGFHQDAPFLKSSAVSRHVR
jgi:hypothetical protein